MEGTVADHETVLPPSDPSEPPADHGPGASGAAGRRPEPRAAGRAGGTGQRHGLCSRWQGQAVLPPLAPPVPVGRPAFQPAHAAGAVRQVGSSLFLPAFHVVLGNLVVSDDQTDPFDL